MLIKAIASAEKFINSKTTSKWEKNVASFLLNILNKNLAIANKNLQDVCKGYSRLQNVEICIFTVKEFCLPAHGLYCIAKKWLNKEEFSQLDMPIHKSFLKDYALWRNENPDPNPQLYMVYPSKMDIVNKVYAMPVAKSVLFEHRWTEQSKFRPAINSDKMYWDFVESLRKMT